MDKEEHTVYITQRCDEVGWRSIGFSSDEIETHIKRAQAEAIKLGRTVRIKKTTTVIEYIKVGE